MPSYYIRRESLYNVPDEKFSGCLGDTSRDAINWYSTGGRQDELLQQTNSIICCAMAITLAGKSLMVKPFLNAAIKLLEGLVTAKRGIIPVIGKRFY